MSKCSTIDRIYRSLLLSKYFTKGWGSPKDIKRPYLRGLPHQCVPQVLLPFHVTPRRLHLFNRRRRIMLLACYGLLEFRKVVSDRDKCVGLIPDHYPVEINKDQVSRGVRLLEGKFHSPFDLYLPELLPEEVKSSHFQMLLPVEWKHDNYKPICIHMAATGDHFYWRRRYLMAKPLLEEAGIASIIVENPFYGVRKPPKQKRSVLNNVLDIFTMGGCLMMEGLVLYNWCKRSGLGPVGFSGYSMGGHMASLAATTIPEPVILVPCLSWSTASGVFTEGVMSKAIDWQLLFSQYNEDESFKSDIKNMVKDLSNDAFRAGQIWIKQYSGSDTKPSPKISGSLTIMNELDDKNYPTLPLNDSSKKAMIKLQDDLKKLSSSPENIKAHENGIFSNIYEQRFALLQRLNQILFSSGKVAQVDWEQHEAFHFMKGIMDECTHIANFTTPADTSLIISVCAEDDGYVPRCGVTDIRDVWPEAEVRYVQGGHVLAFVLHQKAFRQAIMDAFSRYREKYALT